MAVSHTGETTASSSRNLMKHRRRLLILALFAAVVGCFWYLRLPARLTDAESELVGTWTLPMGPNPPPNAVQQIFEMGSNRTLISYHQPRFDRGQDDPRHGKMATGRRDPRLGNRTGRFP